MQNANQCRLVKIFIDSSSMPHPALPLGGREQSQISQVFKMQYLNFWNKSPHSGGRFRGGKSRGAAVLTKTCINYPTPTSHWDESVGANEP